MSARLMGWRTLASVAALGVALSLPTFAAGNGSLSRDEAAFLRKAAADGLAEVELGRLAQERGMRDEVRQFGARMVADHGKANEALMELAGSRRVELPAEVDKKHREDLEKLQKLSGADFDREYMKHMLDDHRKDVKAFDKQAKTARDPEVRDFAARTGSTLRDHLRAAQATYDLAIASKRTGERETGSTRK